MFEVREFATIRMSVHNVSESCAWYKAFFRLEPVENSENFASFRVGTVNFDIAATDEKSPVSQGCVGYWLVDDLESAMIQAQELGAKIYRGPLQIEEIGRTIVQIKDPFGNVFGLEGL